MPKSIPILIVLALSLTSCNPNTDKQHAEAQANKPHAEAQADETAQANKPHAEAQADKPHAEAQADKPHAEAQADETAQANEPHASQSPDDAPTNQGQDGTFRWEDWADFPKPAVEAAFEIDSESPQVAVWNAPESPEFVQKYTQQLNELGFKESPAGSLVFAKNLDSQPRIVKLERAEGDMVVVLAKTIDPQRRYFAVPHADFVLPTESFRSTVFAAEFAQQERIEKGVRYTYINQGEDFTTRYQANLIAHGFVQRPDATTFQKTVDAKPLTVTVERIDDWKAVVTFLAP